MEIMLVLAIIAVLVGAGIYFLTGNLDIAKEQRARSDLQTIKTQLSSYEMENQFLPTTEQGLIALVKQPTTEPVPTRWRPLMEKMPTDPWGSSYQYRIPAQHSGKQYDLYSLGPDRVESKDDIGNWDE
jgi:general secretion pathway protein G